MNEYVKWRINKKERGRIVADMPPYQRNYHINELHIQKRKILRETMGWASSSSYISVLNTLEIHSRRGIRRSILYNPEHHRRVIRSLRSIRLETGALNSNLEMKINGERIIYDPVTKYASSIVNSIMEFAYFERIEIVTTYRGFYKIIREMKTRKAHGIWSYIDTDDVKTDVSPSPIDRCAFVMFFSSSQDIMMFKLKYGHVGPVKSLGVVQPVDVFNMLYNIHDQ